MEDAHLNDIELFEYASGELADAERNRAEQHLSTCAECSSLLALAQSGASVLQASPRFELPAERTAATLAALGAQTSPEAPTPFLRRRWLAVLAPVAAVAGVVAIIVVAGTGSDDQGREAAAPTFEPAPAAAPEEAADGTDRSLQATAETANDEASAAPADEAEALGEASAAEESFDATAQSAEPLAEAPAEAAAEEPPVAGSEGTAPPAEPAVEGEAARPAEEPAAAAPEAAPVEEPSAAPDADDVIASVAGPAEDIVTVLGVAGIEATIASDGAVEVALADVEDATAALAELPAGRVDVRAADVP